MKDKWDVEIWIWNTIVPVVLRTSFVLEGEQRKGSKVLEG